MFCAGGDVREIAAMSLNVGTQYMRVEYYINYCIAKYCIPYVALLNGITMGVGAGLSIHGKYRVATENTVFAMPEVAIGIFTNVGAGHFLSHLPGELGTYLSLTGDRLYGKFKCCLYILNL